MLDKSAQAGQHSYEEREQDCYETPPEAVQALLKVEQLPYRIWEPCCGSGNIAKVLVEAGHSVMPSDLYDYGFGLPGIDFLESAVEVDAVVTNPPYQLAEAFVTKALQLSPLVIMLLRLQFLESKRRACILDRGSGLARVHVFSNRLPLMHRRGWTGPKASSAIAFCWMIWERGYQGPTTIDRISWEKN